MSLSATEMQQDLFAQAGVRGNGRSLSAGVRAYHESGLEPAPVALAANRDGDELVLDLMDFIGADFFGDGITARWVTQELVRADDVKTIRVRLNSPGGDPFEGSAIRSILATAPAKVIVEVHGLAASAATLIAAAGDEVLIADDAMFMVHEAWSIEIGSSGDMRATADFLDHINATMAKTYARFTGQSVAAMRKLMAAETWMDADQALKEGFATGKLEGKSVEASSSERVFAALSKFQHTPDEVLDRYRSQRGELLVAAMSSKPAPAATTPTQTRDDDMNREALCALLGLTASVSDDIVKAAVTDGVQAKALLEETRTELKTAEAKVTELEGGKTVQDIEHRLAQACTTGHDGKGPRLTRPAADALKTKLLARAAKGGLALETVIEDLDEIEGRPALAGVGPSQVRDTAALNAAVDETGLTAEEVAHCRETGRDVKDYAAAKVEAKAQTAARLARRNGTED